MENWGLVTYRETNLLYDPVISSNANKERTATIIAHELAHMVLSFIKIWYITLMVLNNYKMCKIIILWLVCLCSWSVVWQPCDSKVVEWSLVKWRFRVLCIISWCRLCWIVLGSGECSQTNELLMALLHLPMVGQLKQHLPGMNFNLHLLKCTLCYSIKTNFMFIWQNRRLAAKYLK